MTKLLFLLALLAAPAAAAAQPVPAAPDANPAAPEAARPERQICRRSGDTGSRLGSKRVCHTAAEWRQLDAAGGSGSGLYGDTRMTTH